MYALLRERQMKRCCSKTEVFKHCKIDSGFCMDPVEFVLKSEENLGSGIFRMVSNFYRVFQRLDRSVKWMKGYFRHSKYNPKMSVRTVILHVWLIQDICKAFSLLCFLKVPWVAISNKSSRNEECHVISTPWQPQAKYLSMFLHRIILVAIARQTFQKLLGLFSPSLH